MLVERLASGGLGAGRIAWLTTHRILISLCRFSFSFFGGALASVRLVESLSLMHAGDFQRRLLLLHLLPEFSMYGLSTESSEGSSQQEFQADLMQGVFWQAGVVFLSLFKPVLKATS